MISLNANGLTSPMKRRPSAPSFSGVGHHTVSSHASKSMDSFHRSSSAHSGHLASASNPKVFADEDEEKKKSEHHKF